MAALRRSEIGGHDPKRPLSALPPSRALLPNDAGCGAAGEAGIVASATDAEVRLESGAGEVRGAAAPISVSEGRGARSETGPPEGEKSEPASGAGDGGPRG